MASGRYRVSICIDYERKWATFDSIEEAQSWRWSMTP